MTYTLHHSTVPCEHRVITAEYAKTLPDQVLTRLVDQVNTDEQRAAVRKEMTARGMTGWTWKVEGRHDARSCMRR